jgi:outer membrane protein TolC
MLNNPRVREAWFEWVASVERITRARSLPDPQLTFQMDLGEVVMAVMPGLMQMFPGPGKLGAAARVATAESQTKYFALEAAVLQTAFELKRVCYELHLLDESIRILRETLDLLNQLERIARAQNEVGDITLRDVYRAQIKRDQLLTQIANLEDSRRPLLAQFKAALGLAHDQPDPPLPARLETTPLELDGDTLLATAFARNPRLKALEAEVRLAEANLALAHTAKVPDFNLGLMADARATPTMFRPLVGMTLPIWRDKIAAQIAEAQARRRAAEARLTAEQIALAVEFAMRTFEFREVTRNLALLQEQLIPKARRSLEIAQADYLAGQIGFFQLIDAERTLLRFQLDEVSARTRREILLAELSLLIAGVPPQGAPVLASPPEISAAASNVLDPHGH